MKICGMRASSFVIRAVLFPSLLPLLIVAAIGNYCEGVFDWLDAKIPK